MELKKELLHELGSRGIENEQGRKDFSVTMYNSAKPTTQSSEAAKMLTGQQYVGTSK